MKIQSAFGYLLKSATEYGSTWMTFPPNSNIGVPCEIGVILRSPFEVFSVATCGANSKNETRIDANYICDASSIFASIVPDFTRAGPWPNRGEYHASSRIR